MISLLILELFSPKLEKMTLGFINKFITAKRRIPINDIAMYFLFDFT